VDNRKAIPQPTWSLERPGATLVAVTSGKGGVGKSNIAVSLASLAANLGEGATFKRASQPFLRKVVDWLC
jgi:Mrp family chromosome partitioning ATPase